MTNLRRLLATGARRDELQARGSTLPSVTLDGARLADFEALVTGLLWPLRGFGLSPGPDGAWCGVPPLEVPLTAPIADGPGPHVALKDPEGVLLGVLDVAAQATSPAGRLLLSGTVEAVEVPAHDDFASLRRATAVLQQQAGQGRRRVLAYVPRGVPHAGIRASLTAAAGRLDAAVLVLIPSAADEYHEAQDFARVRALEVSAEQLPHECTTLAVVPLALPATFGDACTKAALVAGNLGASHLAVDETDSAPGSTDHLRTCSTASGIEVLPLEPWGYDRRTGQLVQARDADDGVELAPPAEEILSWPPPGLPEWLLTEGEIEAWRRASVPRRAQGFTVFLTGLSGSGKSTIAKALRVKLMEKTGRPVTLLDGDRVRRHLSSELGFSREHRNLNILRIGWVAAGITRHGGIAICAPIAPYDEIRRQVREMIEPAGGFLLVHVSTPLETCEARDRKGLYAKARAGLLPQFTGVSDPYEAPADAALAIDTRHTTVERACEEIMESLTAAGYLEPVR